MKTNEMTDMEINKELAKACGIHSLPPDYCNDNRALIEAEYQIIKTNKDWSLWDKRIARIESRMGTKFISTRERAEVLLKMWRAK